MEAVIGAFVFVMTVIWAHHVEVNTAKTAESLRRIEQQLAGPGMNKKGK